MRVRNSIRKHLAWLAAVLVVAIWGETFVSSKILLQSGLQPADIFFYRFTLAYACMWVAAWISSSSRVGEGKPARREALRLWSSCWRHELMFVALGMLGGSLYFLSENMALVYSTASNVAILVGSTPLVTALLLAIFYKDERMHGRQILGSFIAFAGMVLVITNGQIVLHLNPLGDLLALGAALTWGFYSLVIKQLSRHYDTAFITRKVFAYGLLTILPYFIWHPLCMAGSVFARPVVWANLLYLSLVASMACFLLWNWVLKRLGTVRATNIIYLQAFFTMAASAIVLDERVTLMAVLGALILIAGMLLATNKR